MVSALPVAFRTLFTCLFIFMFGFCAKNKFFFFFFLWHKHWTAQNLYHIDLGLMNAETTFDLLYRRSANLDVGGMHDLKRDAC